MYALQFHAMDRGGWEKRMVDFCTIRIFFIFLILFTRMFELSDFFSEFFTYTCIEIFVYYIVGINLSSIL